MLSNMDYKAKRNQDDLMTVILAGNSMVMSALVYWEYDAILAIAACLCSAVLALNSSLRLTGVIDKIDITK
jgi:hypothetical protein